MPSSANRLVKSKLFWTPSWFARKYAHHLLLLSTFNFKWYFHEIYRLQAITRDYAFSLNTLMNGTVSFSCNFCGDIYVNIFRRFLIRTLKRNISFLHNNHHFLESLACHFSFHTCNKYKWKKSEEYSCLITKWTK